MSAVPSQAGHEARRFQLVPATPEEAREQAVQDLAAEVRTLTKTVIQLRADAVRVDLEREAEREERAAERAAEREERDALRQAMRALRALVRGPLFAADNAQSRLLYGQRRAHRDAAEAPDDFTL